MMMEDAMSGLNLDLENLEELFPDDFTQGQVARAQTIFLKELSLLTHKFYGGKMMTVPKAGLYGFNWFNVWYTPGVSRVSTAIRGSQEWFVPGVTNRAAAEEHPGFNDASFALSNKSNLVGVVSDSTRVLGDGDCTPPGGRGVMEGKSFLMKYLGGVDAIALCINSRNFSGESCAEKIIDFVQMVEPSFGAINLEDIQQPDCYKVLDTLRDACNIPVWHDDAQGTGCVTVSGLLNALKVAGKDFDKARMVLIGAGASNTTIARLLITMGADPERMVLFDTKGALHAGREDLKADTRFYRKLELCEQTNPGGRWMTQEEGRRRDDRPVEPGIGEGRVGEHDGEERGRLRLCQSRSGDLPARGQGGRRPRRGDGTWGLPESGQQLAGLPGDPEGGVDRPRAEGHGRDGAGRRQVAGRLGGEEGDLARLHHSEDG
jgi:malate dehydrogenase (oxaloacetate-decarboxylating)